MHLPSATTEPASLRPGPVREASPSALMAQTRQRARSTTDPLPPRATGSRHRAVRGIARPMVCRSLPAASAALRGPPTKPMGLSAPKVTGPGVCTQVRACMTTPWAFAIRMVAEPPSRSIAVLSPSPAMSIVAITVRFSVQTESWPAQTAATAWRMPSTKAPSEPREQTEGDWPLTAAMDGAAGRQSRTERPDASRQRETTIPLACSPGSTGTIRRLR